MYKLYFIDSKGDKNFIIESNDLKDINKAQDIDLKARGFAKPYYTRSWLDEEGQWIDFGSWSCFYFIEGITLEDMCK